MTAAERRPRVIVVGGGLAGLAAASALGRHGCKVELLEARRYLGGRAASFRDPETGELVDHCQHVAMGCCTNFLDFCRHAGIDGLLRRDETLHFFTLDGKQCDLRASSWLPAPLHLVPGMWRQVYLRRELISIGRAMRRLARLPAEPQVGEPSLGEWLREQHQSPRAIECYWSVVVSSALAETLDRTSLSHARKVFVDGFLANRHGYEVLVPTVPLGELYGQRMIAALQQSGVTLRLEQSVRGLCGDGQRVTGVELADGSSRSADAVVVALPWRPAIGLIDASGLSERLPELNGARQIEGAPITSVHVWFDRPIMKLPHAVLAEALPQWMFRRQAATPGEHYYQMVVSGSRELADESRESVLAKVLGLWQRVFPIIGEAQRLRWRVVTDRDAVFSVLPGIDRLRPAQATSVAGLTLAGDWTATGWPATMEGAVRSGYLAAEAVLKSCGRPASIVVDDLLRGRLARWLL